MVKGTVLLFYKYVSIEYPKQVVKWQKKICQELGLTGRIFVGHEGINGTLGVRLKQLSAIEPWFLSIHFLGILILKKVKVAPTVFQSYT